MLNFLVGSFVFKIPIAILQAIIAHNCLVLHSQKEDSGRDVELAQKNAELQNMIFVMRHPFD